MHSNKYACKHKPVLPLIRQGTQHYVRSKVSATQADALHISSQKIGRLKYGSLKKATSKQIQKKSQVATEQDTIMQRIAQATIEALRVAVQPWLQQEQTTMIEHRMQ